jgi:hypothetical protein
MPTTYAEEQVPMHDATPQVRARSLIERNSLLTLATVDGNARPWVSPVFYSIDDELNLFWVSDLEARHSANVRETGTVAIAIHDQVDGQTDAVYIEATAIELNDKDAVAEGMDVMARRDELQPAHWRINHITDVTGNGPWRVYKATRESISVREMSMKGNKTVVGRMPVDL